MFVRNRTSVEFKYRTHGKVYVLKPMETTFIEDGELTEEELLGFYGSRIGIIKENKKAEVKKEEEKINIEEKKQASDEIDDILKEIKNELEKTTEPGVEEEKQDRISKAIEDVCNALVKDYEAHKEDKKEEPKVVVSDKKEEVIPEKTTKKRRTSTGRAKRGSKKKQV